MLTGRKIMNKLSYARTHARRAVKLCFIGDLEIVGKVCNTFVYSSKIWHMNIRQVLS